jgi:hypothetical protein
VREGDPFAGKLVREIAVELEDANPRHGRAPEAAALLDGVEQRAGRERGDLGDGVIEKRQARVL